MKMKELKNLAQKIAKWELKVQNAQDKKERYQAEQEIMKLSSSVDSLEDIMIIDELVMEILSKNS